MILRIHLPGARDYDVGDEIWQESLADMISLEAETIVASAVLDLDDSLDRRQREALRRRIIRDMTSALASVGDEYRSPDGVRYTLADDSQQDPVACEGTLSSVTAGSNEPRVSEVLRFEDLPLGSAGSRRAVVRWTDGTESAAITFYADEVLFCEGDLLGKTPSQIQSLHFRRDRDWLES